MFRRPSKRRRSGGLEDFELPLVPLMDTMVTLIAFLLMATAMLAVTLVDSPLPIISSEPPQTNKRPLSLTITISQDRYKVESAFNWFKAKEFPRVSEEEDLQQLHDFLVQIKLKHPTERQLILMPEGKVKYDDIVKVMDASRRFTEGEDETLYTFQRDEKGDFVLDEQGNRIEVVEEFLFPNVVFGNILGG